MAREIIVLDIAKTDAGGSFAVTVALWLTAPANEVVPVPNFASRVPVASATITWGVTPAELTALQAGSIVEEVRATGQFPPGTTQATVRAALQALFTTEQATLNGRDAGSKWIGASWDGTTWSAAP